MFNAQDFAARLARREDRWSLLKDFVAEWHGPLELGDGYSAEDIDAAERRLGLKLPLALREYYLLAGQRDDIVAKQNKLNCPEDLEFEDGLLVFYSENQDVVEWGIRCSDLKLADPPVYLNDSRMHSAPQKPIRENETLSEFVLQMLVLETTAFGDFGGNAAADAEMLEIVRQKFASLGLPDWHWPVYLCCFYGSDDIPVNTMVGDGQSGSQNLWVGANSQEAFQHVAEIVALDDWNALNLE